jgi:large subunit ribosomal protein L35
MPKQKTHSGAKKRFIKTASGHIKFRGANRGHNFTHDSGKVARQRRAPHILAKADENHVNKLLAEK